eukprot:CAMPEP_0176389092 /NCGR_PEP_ID=MMETSP0126-20121128/38102_1 /TAXON_ID=141414 ORGANISM="Strombidinopsis acuminatum, Strain SPMC142" /NCGR_SAMPLE_ID=MMETSP0126 /ASSEMBLY_ACC=CAM_ASM_000229 /LENGTH=52 /DNA_ID=CAMNT_0017757703 /DNA_START=1041 /DNA_END=1199 /DNA_ORIENTATION=-
MIFKLKTHLKEQIENVITSKQAVSGGKNVMDKIDNLSKLFTGLTDRVQNLGT